MFAPLFICLFFAAQVFALPANPVEAPPQLEARTFQEFKNSSWNPINWFNNKENVAVEEKQEKKLLALYNALHCVVVDKSADCDKFLYEAKPHFETTAKPSVNPTKTP